MKILKTMKRRCGRHFLTGSQIILVIIGIFAGTFLILDHFFPDRESLLKFQSETFYIAYNANFQQSRSESATMASAQQQLVNTDELEVEEAEQPTTALEADQEKRITTKIAASPKHGAHLLPKKKKNSDTIYFRTATLISEANGAVGIRITSLQECGNRRNTKFRIGKAEVALKKTTVTRSCPWFYAPKCHLVGYYATGTFDETIKLPPRLPQSAEIFDDRKEIWKRIELVDGRSSPTHPHRLAVCLQPVYLMAEWPMIPNFFETWIGNGATIFYIYVHSISEEVDLMLKLYEAQEEIEVVRVNWPALPTSEADDNNLNPNNRMYRTEVATAVNDCILRARATAEYVASSDLDEIITSFNFKGKNETLLDIVEEYKTKTLPKGNLPSAFVFQHSYAYAENDWFHISHPSQLSFDHYNLISYEKKVWPRGYRSKVIYIPDRVYRAHVHDIVQFEKGKFGAVTINPSRARVLHFRQVFHKDMKVKYLHANITLLQKPSDRWQNSYSSRVEAAMLWIGKDMQLRGAFNLSFSAEKWPNLGEKVLKEVELCRDKNYARSRNTCATLWRCRSTMATLRQWVEPDASKAWTVI